MGHLTEQKPHQPPPRRGSILKNPEDAVLSSSAEENGKAAIIHRRNSMPETVPSTYNSAGENIPRVSEKEKNTSDGRRRLSFTSVDIREYKQTLGDHPECSSGPPIALDWSFEHRGSIDVDDYEDHRTPLRFTERGVRAISYVRRKEILTNNAGFSKKELKAATLKKQGDQARRARTKALRRFGKVEEVIESAVRKAKRRAKTSDVSSASSQKKDRVGVVAKDNGINETVTKKGRNGRRHSCDFW